MEVKFALQTVSVGLLMMSSTLLMQCSPKQKAANIAVLRSSDSPTIQYRNADYDFCFSLPKSWSGYSILNGEWQGRLLESKEQDQGNETHGPILAIRHPLWSTAHPRQDIPIMIFTRSQWEVVESEKMAVSAAPIPPRELGHNNRYIFALPARYNYAFPEGYQEVDTIVSSHALHAPCAPETGNQ